jgi:hypothetical protein
VWVKGSIRGHGGLDRPRPATGGLAAPGSRCRALPGRSRDPHGAGVKEHALEQFPARCWRGVGITWRPGAAARLIRVTRTCDASTRKIGSPGLAKSCESQTRGREGPLTPRTVCRGWEAGIDSETASQPPCSCGAVIRVVHQEGSAAGPGRTAAPLPAFGLGPAGTLHPGGGRAPAGRASLRPRAPVGPARSWARTDCSQDSRGVFRAREVGPEGHGPARLGHGPWTRTKGHLGSAQQEEVEIPAVTSSSPAGFDTWL